MGFYIRKAFSFGPLRFNLSRSGVGVSAGVRGLRVGMGPRGTYLHAGRGGLYYRQSLDGSPTPVPAPADWIPPATASQVAIESGSVDNMVVGNEDFLSDLNARASIPRRAPVALAATVVAPVPLYYLFFAIGAGTVLSFAVAAISGAAGAVLTARELRGDRERRTLPLNYQLDTGAQQAFDYLLQAFESLRTAAALWHIPTAGVVANRKYSGGAAFEVARTLVSPALGHPPHVRSNLTVPSLAAGRQTLYFLPDRLLVWDSRKFGAVSYTDLIVHVEPQRFNEEGVIPGDAEVVETTWRFINKSGGPDRRFRDNREIPVMRYFNIGLSSGTGLKEGFMVSSRRAAEHLRLALDHIAGRKATSGLYELPR